MIESILSILGALFSWLAAKGIDSLVGKWLAYITIAWEARASDKAKKAFDDAMKEIKVVSPEKSKAWEEWRKRAAASNGS